MNERPILLVEDSADDVELTTLALTEAKITNPVVVASNGVEALDYLLGTGAHAGRDAAEQPVVVLLDIKLPLLSGIDVLRRMREDERTRRTPVVMLTSSKEQVDIAATYDLGANSYRPQPAGGRRVPARAEHVHEDVDAAPCHDAGPPLSSPPLGL